MQIKEIFQKPIDREIPGVVTVGGKEKTNTKQELEEYVVTKELNRHFAELFDNYKTGINGETRKNGVWISGFFGSGKSHFLKMVSYLLENKEIEGKKAIDYFIEDNKIKDPAVLADIKLAAYTPTDVILFNIDSKAEQTSKQSKDALVNVFLKVFNDMQGFYGSMPYLADLEKQLQEEGKYELFKETFKEEFGKDWESSRQKFDFIQDTIVDVLVDIGFMSEEAARNFCEKAIGDYKISIEDFAKRVDEYIRSKGNNHHLVFLVDEVGQYIGDNSRLMLNLQTIQEELGKRTLGRSWIMVTSQQDIDSITKVIGNDFSKIQGRFDTRISLTSSNVDEVIRERILKKNDVASDMLKATYESYETALGTKLRFNDTPEMKLYRDSEDFAQNYPFIPYQFNLLGAVLNSIRMHGASGKHLSEGERSMLSLFKESAESIKNDDIGRLVPFYQFYNALERFLDASHSRVITQALANQRINPKNDENNFAVNVLKVLFLIKYVKELENATVENITSLMVSHIDEDRIELQRKVEKALKVLEKETLIQRNGKRYIFLTEEEQEIGREIDNQQVQQGEVIDKIYNVIFNDIYSESRYKHPNNINYTFDVNKSVDDRISGNRGDIGIKVITPFNGTLPDDLYTLKAISGQGHELFIVLPDNDTSYYDELEYIQKIDRFSSKNSANGLDRYQEIIRKKQNERDDRYQSARLSLVDNLKNATFLVKAHEVTDNKKDIAARINKGLAEIVEDVYNKLNYISHNYNENDLLQLLKDENQESFTLENGNHINQQAIDEVFERIVRLARRSSKVSLTDIKNIFKKAPYGFLEEDINWIIGKLLKEGEITLELNGDKISLLDKTSKEIVNIIFNRRYADRLIISPREHIDERLLKPARSLLHELSGLSTHQYKEDELKHELDERIRDKINELNRIKNKAEDSESPGYKVIYDGLNIFNNILNTRDNKEYFETLKYYKDSLNKFFEKYEDIKNFYSEGSTQYELFKESGRLLNIYNQSKDFQTNSKLEEIVQRIKKIRRQSNPFDNIPDLSGLNQEFRNEYHQLIEAIKDETLEKIEAQQEEVLETLELKPYKDKYFESFNRRFDQLRKRVKEINGISQLYASRINSERLVKELLNILKDEDERLLEQEKIQEVEVNLEEELVQEEKTPIKTKTNKTIRLSNLVNKNNIVIEDETDINQFVNFLKQELEKLLKESPNSIIHFKF